MKTCAVSIFFFLTSFAYAQEYYPYHSSDQTYAHSHQNNTSNNDTNNKDKMSRSAKDASNENVATSSNGQDASNQDKKSTPSKDATSVEEKNDKQEEKKEGDKKEAEKKEDSEKKEEEKPKSPHTFTSNVSLVSDYRFRGLSQTMRRPAIQGGFDYSHVSGLYLGIWASNADGTTHYYNNTSLEWDFYGGYKGKFFPCSIPDFAYNVGLIYYYYPGGKSNTPKSVRYNTAELYIEMIYKWFSVKYWQTLTNYFGTCSDNPPFNWEKNRPDKPNGSSRASTYIEANVTFDLYKKMCWPRFCLEGGKLNVLVHIGHQTVRNYEHLSYTDWRATLTQEFDWFNIFVSYVGTNAKPAYLDVPDNTFHAKKRHLGAQGVVIGVIRIF